MSRYAGWEHVTAPPQPRQERGYTFPELEDGEGRTHNTRRIPRPQMVPVREPALAADVFPALKRLATQHGWENRYTYNAIDDETGSAIDNDPGLHLYLVRDESILDFYLLDEGMRPTPVQRGWIDAMHKTGKVEAAIWYPADFDTIKARLTRSRKEAGAQQGDI